ncbi:MAG: hypothetical protein KC502_22365 [Myxococcales bacterium]|nr:hypothetical protein [Myxococcales bacterium]
MTAASTVRRADTVNLAAQVVSLALAWHWPLATLLVSFAVLGPLHYLTELRWLHAHGWGVTKPKPWIWVLAGLALAFSLPFLLALPWLRPLVAAFSPGRGIAPVFGWINGLLLIALVTCAALVATENKWLRWLAFGCGCGLAFALQGRPTANLWLGFYLPSLVHVFGFTSVFVWVGARRSGHPLGWCNGILLLAIPVLIALLPLNPADYAFDSAWRAPFVANSFHLLPARLGESLGVGPERAFYFDDAVSLRLQIFVTFAYLHHYLNWFAKTEVIGWHRGMRRSTLALMLVIWVVCVATYVWDYRVGFAVSMSLSTLHLVLEFPVDFRAMRSLVVGGQSLIRS